MLVWDKHTNEYVALKREIHSDGVKYLDFEKEIDILRKLDKYAFRGNNKP